jgi:hypothetical protein
MAHAVLAIWVRKTVPWDDEEAFLAQVPEGFRRKVDVWNETFTTPYHVFRSEVRRIADVNHAAVRGAVSLHWEEIPDGELVLPVDDDDWFAPDIGEALARHRDPDAAAYRWSSSFLEVPIGLGHELYVLRHRLFPGARPRWSCTTNNYALVKQDGVRELAVSHMRASAWVDGSPPGQVAWIPARLSLQNRTLASQTSLAYMRPDITRSQILRKLRRYRRLYRRWRSAELTWARPYVEMMAALTDRLEPR